MPERIGPITNPGRPTGPQPSNKPNLDGAAFAGEPMTDREKWIYEAGWQYGRWDLAWAVQCPDMERPTP